MKDIKNAPSLRLWIDKAVSSDFGEDLDALTTLFQIMTDQGLPLPVVRLIRNKTKVHKEYGDPRETIYWFATQVSRDGEVLFLD